MENYTMENYTMEIQSLNQDIIHIKKNMDDFFLVMNGIIVTALQAGFACFEAGSLRSKSVTSVMIKNYLDTLVGCIAWFLTGFSLAFSSGNQFFGLTWWAGYGIPRETLARWFFQFSYASTASTIISGAVAERASFCSYLITSFCMTGLVYPPVLHWVWAEEGWLKLLHFKDFSGGLMVHGLAGTASLVAAITLGPRICRFSKVGDAANDVHIQHSTALMGIGGLLILFGFTAFNAGSLEHLSKPGDGAEAAVIVINTIIGGSGGAITALILSYIGIFGSRSWNFYHTMNGGLMGMVSSCAACNVMSILEAFIVGCTAIPFYVILHATLIYLKIDDPLDACPVHLGGGLWSVLSIPIIARGGIIKKSSDVVLKELVIALTGVAAIVMWSLTCSVILFGSMRILGIFRISKKSEIIGNDLAEHHSEAYPVSQNYPPYNSTQDVSNYTMDSDCYETSNAWPMGYVASAALNTFNTNRNIPNTV